jgi:hypothetical protein
MSARRDRPRGFTLTVEAGPSGSYGLRLDEVPHDGQPPHGVAHLSPARAARVIEDVLAAVQASGHPRSSLSSQTSQSLRLEEAPGVRLALTMLATGALQKQSRVDETVAAIGRLGDEEAYYWYGKCIGETGARARRAFRLLLSRD